MSRWAGYMRVLSLGFPFRALTRDLWLICLSNVIGAFGEGLYFWVFPLYIGQLHADYVQLGLVFSVLYGASALAPLPGGLLADRFDRKKILILAWAPWVFAPLLYSFAQNWLQLIPGAVCWGISMIGVPAVNAYIITSVSDGRNLASVLSFVWASYSFSYIFAPTVGAFLATIVGMRWVLRLAALLCAVATIVFIFLRSQQPRKHESTILNKPLVKGKQMWRQMLIWSGFYSTVTFFATVVRPFVPAFLDNQVGLSEFQIGLFGSLSYAGMTFLGIAMGRYGDRRRKSTAISLCLMLYLTSLVSMALIREPVTLMFMAFLYGSPMVMGSLVSSYVGAIAPENRRGFWVSIPQTLSLLAAVAAPYIGGYLFTQSVCYALIVSIIPMPLLALIAFTKLKE